MRLYKVDECRCTEIDVNSIEGIGILNTYFSNTDLSPGNRLVYKHSKDSMNTKFMLSLTDDDFEKVIDLYAEYLFDDVNSLGEKIKEIIHDDYEELYYELLKDNDMVINITSEGLNIEIHHKGDTKEGKLNETLQS